MPAGFTEQTDLPVGIDLMGRPYAEETLFQLAYAYEQGTRHRVVPEVAPSLVVPEPEPEPEPEPVRASSTTLRSSARVDVRRDGRPVRLTIQVRSAGPLAGGRVEVRRAGRTIRAKRVDVRGRATVWLPDNLRRGRHTFRAWFLGSDRTAGSTSAPVVVRVVRRR